MTTLDLDTTRQLLIQDVRYGAHLRGISDDQLQDMYVQDLLQLKAELHGDRIAGLAGDDE